MHLTFSPMRRDDRLSLHRAGDTLIVNGERFDFGPLPEGASLPRDAVNCEWLISDVTRKGGKLHLALILPLGAVSQGEALFPAPLLVERDGPVTLPGATCEEEDVK